MASRGYNDTMVCSESVMDTVRLFLDCVDFSDLSCDGWNVIFEFAEEYVRFTVNPITTLAFFEWILKLFSQEMKASLIASEYADIMCFIAGGRDLSALHSILRLGPKGAVDYFCSDGFNSLLCMMAYAEVRGAVSELPECGADPNCVGIAPSISPRLESPTSLAMYSSEAFVIWLSSLADARIDINNVFERELEKGPLPEAGWTREALYMLLDWDFEATSIFKSHHWT